MGYAIVVIMSFSILPASLAGILKFRQVEAIYYPILILLAFGLDNEMLSSFLIFNGYSNAVNSNIFLLIEVIFILWQFKCWGLYDEYSVLVPYIMIALVLCWLFIYRKPEHLLVFLPLFRYLASGLIVIMSMLMIIKLAITYNGPLLKFSIFLFSMGFCVYFSTCVLVEVLLQMDSTLSGELKDKIFRIGSIVNVICNLIYLIAVLWMPMKPRYITP